MLAWLTVARLSCQFCSLPACPCLCPWVPRHCAQSVPLLSPPSRPRPPQLTILPPVHELQRDAATRWRWVNYSAFDAKSTWDLYQRLRHELMAMEAVLDAAVASDYAQVCFGMGWFGRLAGRLRRWGWKGGGW